MKKLLQKAMVFTLTAAMLIGTPLTASAASLVDLYQTVDGWGNVVGSNGEDDTNTGTVTVTQSNSSVLKADEGIQDEGIKITPDNFEFELPEDAGGDTVTAEIKWKEGNTVPADIRAQMNKLLKWSSSNSKVVALQMPTNYNVGDIKNDRTQMRIVPKGAGEATVTVSLDSDKYDIHHSATVNVTVVEYADTLEFDVGKLEADAFSGTTLDLEKYVIRKNAEGKEIKSSDQLTFALIDDQKKKATLKNGILTLKKATEAGKKIKIRVTGKYCSDEGEFPITAGRNASKVRFESKPSDGAKQTGTKFNWKVNEGMTSTVTAEVTERKSEGKKAEGACTDQFTWSSANTGIIKIVNGKATHDEDNKYEVEVKAVSAGKTQIIATASSGKTFKLTATVGGDLTDIKIDTEVPGTVYTGQIIDLNGFAHQYFGADDTVDFMDAGLKWTYSSATDKPTKKVAKLKSNGLLTITPEIGEIEAVTVQVTNAKKIKYSSGNTINAGQLKTLTVPLNLGRVDVESITVKGGTLADSVTATLQGSRSVQTPDKKKAVDTINVGDKKTYALEASGYYLDKDGKRLSEEAVVLSDVVGWSASGKSIAATKYGTKGVLKGLKKGSATITVSAASSYEKNGKTKYTTLKATFKSTVFVPTDNLTLSVKKSGIQALDRNQTVKITAKVDKGSTVKAKDLTWTVYSKEKNSKAFVRQNDISASGGTIKHNFNGEAGTRYKVVAKVPDKNVTATVYFDVVTPNKTKPTFSQTSESGDTSIGSKGIDLTVGEIKTVNIGVAGTDESDKAAVTYTVNKPGLVFVIGDRSNKHTIKIVGTAAGKAVVTVTTSDGKKATLKVNVSAASAQ